MKRDMAGSFQVNGGTGKVIRTCVVDGHLEIYKIDKTFRAKTPDGLDPERKNPDMPWVISEHSEYGCGHPIVARLLLQSRDILQGAIFSRGIDQEKIVSVLYDSKEFILKCESIVLVLGQEMDEIEAPLREKGVEMDDDLRYINPFPQVKDLNDLCSRFLVSAKRCIQNYAILIDHFYGTGIRTPRFHKIKNWAKDNVGDDSYLFKIVSEQEPELLRIINLRNFQEHPNDDKKTEINNYTLLPEMAIKQPEWFVTGEDSKYIFEDMRDITSYLFQLGEMLFLHSVLENVSKSYPYIIYMVEEDKIDENCPIAYRLSIDDSKLKKI